MKSVEGREKIKQEMDRVEDSSIGKDEEGGEVAEFVQLETEKS